MLATPSVILFQSSMSFDSLFEDQLTDIEPLRPGVDPEKAVVAAELLFGPANLVQYPRDPSDPVRRLSRLCDAVTASWLQFSAMLSKLDGA
jgi:hypothetical protein